MMNDDYDMIGLEKEKIGIRMVHVYESFYFKSALASKPIFFKKKKQANVPSIPYI